MSDSFLKLAPISLQRFSISSEYEDDQKLLVSVKSLQVLLFVSDQEVYRTSPPGPTRGGNSLRAVTPGETLGTLYISGVGTNKTKQHTR